jgi:hypothetical protein
VGSSSETCRRCRARVCNERTRSRRSFSSHCCQSLFFSLPIPFRSSVITGSLAGCISLLHSACVIPIARGPHSCVIPCPDSECLVIPISALSQCHPSTISHVFSKDASMPLPSAVLFSHSFGQDDPWPLRVNRLPSPLSVMLIGERTRGSRRARTAAAFLSFSASFP